MERRRKKEKDLQLSRQAKTAKMFMAPISEIWWSLLLWLWLWVSGHGCCGHHYIRRGLDKVTVRVASMVAMKLGLGHLIRKVCISQVEFG
jgi:hypothetical protein